MTNENENVLDQEYDIFNTNVEDMTSYDEREKTDWSKVWFEPDPQAAGKELTFLIKLCPNIYNPKENIPKSYTYKLPRPDNPTRNFIWRSPSSEGKPCPVMQFWLDHRNSSDARLKGIAETLKRKQNKGVVIQIISAPSDPELAGQFRIWKFTEGFEIDNMIKSIMNPSKDDIDMNGAVAHNPFDPFQSRLLIVKVSQGTYGRDFTASIWAKEEKDHGIILYQLDEEGNIIDKDKKIILKKEDSTGEKAKTYQQEIIKRLKADNINLKEYVMLPEHTEEEFDYVNKALKALETGEIIMPETGEGSSKETEKSDSKLDEKVDTITTTQESKKEESPKETKADQNQSQVDALFG